MATKTPMQSKNALQPAEKAAPGAKKGGQWQLFTAHGLVLLSVLNHPDQTIREIGLELNLTERSVAQALADLVCEGYITRQKVGRRVLYQINEDHPLKYPVSAYGLDDPPYLTVRALRAENLATHHDHILNNSEELQPT